MRKDWKYVLYISLAFGLFIVVKLASPKQYNWSITFGPEDKNPYGAYSLSTLLPSLFPGSRVAHSYKTVYEIKDSLKSSDNIIILASNFSADKEDSKILLKHVEGGGTVFISAQYFLGHFSDTLGVTTYDYFFKDADIFSKRDTAILRFSNTNLDTLKEYRYRRDNTHNYFNRFNASRTSVIAKNDRDMPVTIRVQRGKGNFILNSTPLIFTNIYLLAQINHEFISTTLSHLPKSNVIWTEYYHRGRMEASTPLRFILTNEPLKWAYYITVITLLLFMIFEMKRRQRIIPIIKPLANSTLEFVSTIGNLYFQSAEHKNIAEKKIHFFIDQLRTKYWLNTTHLDETFIKITARKTEHAEEDVRSLINLINSIRSKLKISSEELTELNAMMEKFNFFTRKP